MFQSCGFWAPKRVCGLLLRGLLVEGRGPRAEGIGSSVARIRVPGGSVPVFAGATSTSSIPACLATSSPLPPFTKSSSRSSQSSEGSVNVTHVALENSPPRRRRGSRGSWGGAAAAATAEAAEAWAVLLMKGNWLPDPKFTLLLLHDIIAESVLQRDKSLEHMSTITMLSSSLRRRRLSD